MFLFIWLWRFGLFKKFFYHTLVLASVTSVSSSSSSLTDSGKSGALKPVKVGLMGNRLSQRARLTTLIPRGKS